MAKIIPARPLPPGPVNTGTIYDQVSSYTVAAGSYLYGVDLTLLFYWGTGTLINQGGIFLDAASEFGGVVRIAPNGTISSIDNQGVIVAYGRDLGGASASFNNTQVFDEFRYLTNSGQIFSISEKAHARVLSSYVYPQIVNSGLLAAYSGAQSATVLFMPNGGRFVNTATGVVLAEGHEATGLVVGNGLDPSVYEVENAGRIEAASIAGGKPSVGIFSEYSDIRNTGLIKADIAVAMSGVLSNAGRIEGPIAVLSHDLITVINEASGVIAGDIEGGLGQDRIENSGRVEGDAFLSGGNDSFLNLGGGSVTGVVDLGLGDDVYAGHSGLDRVAGDNGRDEIDGAGGNDLLVGGNDSDRLVGGAGNDGLYGERGADTLVTLGGDHADGGREDDRIELGDYSFAFAGGGQGVDTLVLPGGARVIELGLVLAGGRVAGFEVIALGGSKVLIVNPGNVAALADGGELRIDATASDRVELVGAWTAQANVERGGALYRVYTLGGETVLVKDGAAIQVLATPTPGGVGLDSVAGGAAAPVPGEESGLTLTPDVLHVQYLEIFEPTTIYQGEIWFTTGSAPAIYAWRDSAALDNQGTLSAFNDVQATAIAVQFTNLAGIVNDGLIYAESTGAVVGPVYDHFPLNLEGAYAIQDSIRVINRGDIVAYSLNGMASAMGQLDIDPAEAGSYIPTTYQFRHSVEIVANHGYVEAISEGSYALGIVGVVEFDNDGDIFVAGVDGAIGVVAVREVDNRGTIEALSLGVESIGLLLMGADSPYIVVNSGTIVADVAIRAHVDPWREEFALQLDNGGWIEGRIEASTVADSIVNSGDIFGEVLLNAGDDFFDGSAGTQIYGVFGGAGNDVIKGGVGDDFLSGDGGNDSLTGGAGADWLFVAAGQSSADGGSGDDLLSVDFSAATLAVVTLGADGAAGYPAANPGGGFDGALTDGGGNRIAFTSIETFEITTGSGADTVRTGAGDDWVLSGAGNDSIETGGGNDHLDGGSGADWMSGGSGDDDYVVDSASDTIVEAAGGGTDHVLAWSSYTLGSELEKLTLAGAAANGTGNGLANLIVGNSADNFLDGQGGADRMEGGLGNDTYGVDSLLDQAVEAEGEGTDTVVSAIDLTLGANLENLKAVASAAGLALTGNDGDNALTGGNGNDILNGGLGNDQLAGGLGDDIYLVGAGDSVAEAAGAGNDEVRTALAAYTLTANVEALTGLAATGQALTGNGLANIVTGGSGNDVLDGAAGADQLAGGLGNDVYVVDSGDAVTEAAGAGTDEVRTALAAYVLAANVETLTGLAATGQALTGNGLANLLTGGSGNDVLDGAGGADQLAGGLGNDVYIVGTGDTVSEAANAGTDEVRTALAAYTLAAEVERLVGTSATGQALTGNGLANVLTGGSGNDVLDGGAGADQLAGGLGNDVYIVGTGDSVAENAGEGSDEVRTALAAYTLGADLERLTGTSATGQVLTGNGLANILTGGGGNDVLDGGAGADQLAGGLGDDLYFIGDGDSVTEAAGAGVDEVRTAIADTVAPANVEKLTGLLDIAQTLRGNGLDNIIAGGAGADRMVGGLGNDVYLVGTGDNVIEKVGEGTDEVRTALAAYTLTAEVETLTGTSAAGQTLTGNSGHNAVTGGGGDDVLLMHGGGNDVANGGAGNDNIFFIGTLTSADVVNGGAGVDTLVVQGPYGSLTLSANVTQIENVSILAGSNTNFGEPGTNRYDYVLTTHDANFAAGVQARVNGSALLAGEDFTFDGSAETDASYVVYGGKGKDTLLGGLGNDIFFYAEERFASGDTVNGGAGYDGMFLRGNYTIDFNAPGYTGLFTNIENLTLTSATDERYARGGGTEFDYNLTLSDAIVGAGQELTVSGALLMVTETMILDGSQETDGRLRLFGGKSADTLKGGGQADLLHGALGADILSGGGGADAFRYQAVTESNAPSRDHIIDFTPGTDKIELDRIDANTGVGGNQAFTWIGSNAFSKSASELRAYQSGANWIVEGDINGDGFADLVIALTLQGATPLGAGDFVL